MYDHQYDVPVCLIDQQTEAAKEFDELHKKDLEKVKDMKLEEWV